MLFAGIYQIHGSSSEMLTAYPSSAEQSWDLQLWKCLVLTYSDTLVNQWRDSAEWLKEFLEMESWTKFHNHMEDQYQ